MSGSLQLVGLPDDFYRHDTSGAQQLVTRQEVRMAALGKLGLTNASKVWDIGAGSGSVGIEAARLAVAGHVWGIEKTPERVELIEENRRKLGVTNYSVIEGSAPERLDTLPDPNAIFIGGSAGQLEEIMSLCFDRLVPGGRLVSAFVTLENFATATSWLKRQEWPWEVTSIQVARSRPILDMTRLKAENPVWLVTVTKETKEKK